MSINLKLRDSTVLADMFNSRQTGIKVRDLSVETFTPSHTHETDDTRNRTQSALIFSVLEVNPTYHVAAVWLPDCETFNSDFAIIHVENGVVTKAAIADPDQHFQAINVDDPDCAYATLSVGYCLFRNDERPVARWFTEADSCDVHHRVAHHIEGMRGEHHLGSR